MKKLNIKIINKSTGEFTQYDTKEFCPNTPTYNNVVTSLVNLLHKVLDDPDEFCLCVDNVHLYEYKEGNLFDLMP